MIRKLPDGTIKCWADALKAASISTGEWQRMALARAYLRDAQLLILDEPTAHSMLKANFKSSNVLQNSPPVRWRF